MHTLLQYVIHLRKQTACKLEGTPLAKLSTLLHVFQGLQKCSIESFVRFLEKWLLAGCLPASFFSAVSLFPRERLSQCCTTLSIGQKRQTGSSSYNTSLLHYPHWWDSHSTRSRDIPVCSQCWKRLTCFQQLAGLAIPIKKLIVHCSYTQQVGHTIFVTKFPSLVLSSETLHNNAQPQ